MSSQAKCKFTFSPLKLFSKLYKMYNYAFLLESVEGPKKLARYSFIGFDPEVSIKIKNDKAEVSKSKTGEKFQARTNSPLNFIKKTMKPYQTLDKTYRFIGGAVGYVSYDIIRGWEKIPCHAKDDLEFPDIEMGLYNDGIIFDHSERRMIYYYLNRNRFSELNEILIDNYDDEEELFYASKRLNITQEKFEDIVEKAKEYIYSGDIFQVVLSKRYEFNVKGSLIGFYWNLRRINPSPYMYFIKMRDRQIVGSSPEMLVRVENEIVETFPIAGTRPRKKGKAQNAALVK
ncbi:MAG: chorismate-binding protein, partial [Candidatus Bathyarchaeia archaeon]